MMINSIWSKDSKGLSCILNEMIKLDKWKLLTYSLLTKKSEYLDVSLICIFNTDLSIMSNVHYCPYRYEIISF